MKPTSLEGDIIARLKNMLSHYAWSAKRMKIRFEGLDGLPRIRLDRAHIERAINNLLVNAIKYGKRGSTVNVGARWTASHLVVDVSNEGIGIAPDEEPYLYEAYYRSDRAKASSAQGVGLGLTIAKEIMVAHGGDLCLTFPKDPTVFSLQFPVKLVCVEKEKDGA